MSKQFLPSVLLSLFMYLQIVFTSADIIVISKIFAHMETNHGKGFHHVSGAANTLMDGSSNRECFPQVGVPGPIGDSLDKHASQVQTLLAPVKCKSSTQISSGKKP